MVNELVNRSQEIDADVESPIFREALFVFCLYIFSPVAITLGETYLCKGAPHSHLSPPNTMTFGSVTFSCPGASPEQAE